MGFCGETQNVTDVSYGRKEKRVGIWVFSALGFGGMAAMVVATTGSAAIDGIGPLAAGVIVAFFVLLVGIGAQMSRRE